MTRDTPTPTKTALCTPTPTTTRLRVSTPTPTVLQNRVSTPDLCTPIARTTLREHIAVLASAQSTQIAADDAYFAVATRTPTTEPPNSVNPAAEGIN